MLLALTLISLLVAGSNNESCKNNGWIHYPCEGLPKDYEPPENVEWFCITCRQNPEASTSSAPGATSSGIQQGIYAPRGRSALTLSLMGLGAGPIAPATQCLN